MSSFTSKFSHIPPATLILIIINVAAYIILPLVPGGSALYASGAVSALAVENGEWWTMFTSMFLHAGLMHILCNMFSLYYLGVMSEKFFGTGRFIILYFLCGLAGNAAFIVVNMISGSPAATAVGASGAIFGLFGAYGYLLLRDRMGGRVFLYGTSRADIQSYIVILAVNLMIGLAPGSNIANEAHIGGMICGFILGAILYASSRRSKTKSEQ